MWVWLLVLVFRFGFFFFDKTRVFPLENARRNKPVYYKKGNVLIWSGKFGSFRGGSSVPSPIPCFQLFLFLFPCSLGKNQDFILTKFFLWKSLSWEMLHRI